MSSEAVDTRMTVGQFRRLFPTTEPYPNPSGLKPLGVAVLVKPYDSELNRKSSLIALPPSVVERLALYEDRVVVIEVGAWAWHDEPEPRAKPGDKVIIAKFAGIVVQGTADGETYRMVNDRDIYTQITRES